ncbi:MAG: hypothetical protein QXS68_08500, partial [Candidatus Methanomethylicaceae archaeon]
MWIHESPERLVIRDEPGWGWGIGGALVAVGIVLLGAAVGAFSGVSLLWGIAREILMVLSLGLIGLGTVLLLLGHGGWILEMDRIERSIILRREGLFLKHSMKRDFQDVIGARVVPLETGNLNFALEIIGKQGPKEIVFHRFIGD